ncbi:hypothetical protein ABGN05_20805 [Aquibium sp. LZ166]|uniref:SPOR domain-containing protein n=1 Tax=Aquibium pacificus TaxID=3153579 RepID=A0ABV3SMU6_9HYPH
MIRETEEHTTTTTPGERIERTTIVPEERTTVVHTGGGSGAGWFIVGGLVVLLLLGVWLFGGGMLDGTGTASIDVNVPEKVTIETPNIEAPKVDVAPAEAD